MGLRAISLNDLEGLSESHDSYRACCPVHGGRNRTALVIDKTGRYPAGIGYCFVCGGNVVLVRELYSSLSEGERAHVRSLPSGRRNRPAPLKVAKSWQVAEHQVLRSLHERMRYSLEMSPRALAYLESRETPLWVAQQIGLLYLSRKVLDDPEYAPYSSLLYRWVDSIIFPLYRKVWEDSDPGEQYLQGYIGRTLKLWRTGMDEDTHKSMLDAYNCEVRASKEHPQEGQRPRHEILRWVKTEPAGWFYPGTPSRIGKSVVLVEGGWDCCGVLSALAQLVAQHADRPLFPAGSVVGLAGTAADPGLLPATAEAVLLALDDDDAGRNRMLLLREDHLRAGRPTYILSLGDESGKDWSARWRRLGIEGIRPLLMAYRYVDAWQKAPLPTDPCLVLVDNLSDALALLEASDQQGSDSWNVEPNQVVVLTSNLFSSTWFLPRVHTVVFASCVKDVQGSDSDARGSEPVFRTEQEVRERTLRLRDDLQQAGVRVYQCPPPVDGLGATWSDRWCKHGYKGVKVLLDAYTYAQEPLLKSA